MSAGIESVLKDRYGDPTIAPGADFLEYRWNEHDEKLTCLLYKALATSSAGNVKLRALGPVYGDALGGFLLLDSLRLAMLAGPPVYGLYAIDELWAQPEVSDANRLNREIQFFMDAANVWFYGMKEGELYVYDSEAAELMRLGPFDLAIRELLEQWEQAAPP